MLPLADLFLAGSSPLPPSQPPDAAEAELFGAWCAEAGCTRAQLAVVCRRVERLDFTRSMSRIKGVFRPRSGIRSHGAVSLAKVRAAAAWLLALSL